MTYIALHADAEHADIFTDTWTYEGTGRTLGHTSKVHALPHIDTAVVTQGDQAFGLSWDRVAAFIASDVSDFDDFTRSVVGPMRKVFAQHAEQAERDLPPSTVFHVGLSAETGQYRAVGYSSDNGFLPFPIEGLHVMPAPFSMRLSRLELGRFEAEVARHERSSDAANLALLKAAPVVTEPPATLEEWVTLALRARHDRSIAASVNTRLKVFVGGALQHTHMRPASISHQTLLRFNDTGDELAAIMRGTLHPLGQTGPCECGSGVRYLECCLEKIADEPCLCGGPSTLRGCCMLDAEAVAAPAC